MELRAKYVLLIASLVFLCSCSVFEKSSRHGFESGYYEFKSDKNIVEKVYLEVENEKVEVYPRTENQLGNKMMSISLITTDSLFNVPLKFNKKSLDIDITTILLKCRIPVDSFPAQLTADLNVALYAGWRHDTYRIQGKRDPLGKYHYEIINRGFDFGFFAGPGSTLISPFTTQNLYTLEYTGMILQFGLAGFLESGVASFGIATGFDYLLSSERNIWIYNNKPWVGFIIGIALN